MNLIKKIIKDSLTGADNVSYDNGRVLCSVSFIAFFLLSGVSVHYGHFWSPIEFASGVATMAVGFGINLHLKKQTEPGETENKPNGKS